MIFKWLRWNYSHIKYLQDTISTNFLKKPEGGLDDLDDDHAAEVGGKQGFLGSRKLRRKADARFGVEALVKEQEVLAHEIQRGAELHHIKVRFGEANHGEPPAVPLCVFQAGII